MYLIMIPRFLQKSLSLMKTNFLLLSTQIAFIKQFYLASIFENQA